MGRILAGSFLCAAIMAPACAVASPLYVYVQADNLSGGAGLGYVFNGNYAIEARYRKSREVISYSGVTSDTNITAAGFSVLALFPMRWTGGTSYTLFAKVGYEQQSKEEVYSFPVSVTYNGTVTNIENHTFLGGGLQVDFSRHLAGRTGIELIGGKRSIYWAAVYTF